MWSKNMNETEDQSNRDLDWFSFNEFMAQGETIKTVKTSYLSSR